MTDLQNVCPPVLFRCFAKCKFELCVDYKTTKAVSFANYRNAVPHTCF